VRQRGALAASPLASRPLLSPAQATACVDGVLRIWQGVSGECVAHAALSVPAGSLCALAGCADPAGVWRLAAAASGAVFLLRGPALELTRVLRGAELPRGPLLALSCVAAEHSAEPASAWKSSGSLSSLASVRAEEEQLELVGVEQGGGAWSWAGSAAGEIVQTDRPTRRAAASPLALLGWAREEAAVEAADATRPTPPQRGPVAASLSADGAHALIVSPDGWALLSTARPAPGALPPPAAASGDAAGLVGGALLPSPHAGAARVALLAADGALRVLELSLERTPRRAPPPARELLCARLQPGCAALLACCAGEDLLAVASSEQLSLLALPAAAPLRPPPPSLPLSTARLADGWPAAGAGGDECTASLVSGGCIARGRASGEVTLEALVAGDGRAPLTLRGHEGAVRCLTAQGGVLLSGGVDCCVRAWALADGAPLACLRHHASPLAALHAPGGQLVSEARDGSLGLLRLEGEGLVCDRLLAWPGAAPPTGPLRALAWAPASATLACWWPEGGELRAHAWDALGGALDRSCGGAAAEELRALLLGGAQGQETGTQPGSLGVGMRTLDCSLAWAPLLAVCGDGELAVMSPQQLRRALSLLHAWGLDAELDALVAAQCGGRAAGVLAAAAVAGAAGAATLLTPAGAARHALLAGSGRFVARRSLAVCALARRLQRSGGDSMLCSALLAFYAAQLQEVHGRLAAAPALAVYACAWQHASECVREAARALLASAPERAVPPQLRQGDVSCWRAVEEAAGGAAEGSPACSGRVGVLVAAAAAVCSLRRSDGDVAARGLHPAAHPHVLAALRRLAREAPAPHGAAALALLAAGVPAWWAAVPDRAALADEALALCEQLAAAGGVGSELMVAREACAELLQALAEASAPTFLDALMGRLQAPGTADSAAHMTAFLALIHSLQERGGALLLRPHLERCLEAACLALQPHASYASSFVAPRRSCAAGAAGFLAELQLRCPAVAAQHRVSGRMAVAVPAGPGQARPLLRLYDTGASGAPAAGLLRVLEGDAEHEAGDCAALAFDADGGRLASYHALGGGCGVLRFWVLGAQPGTAWRFSRGLAPARACAVEGTAAASERLRLEWVLGHGSGVKLLDAERQLAFLSVVH